MLNTLVRLLELSYWSSVFNYFCILLTIIMIQSQPQRLKHINYSFSFYIKHVKAMMGGREHKLRFLLAEVKGKAAFIDSLNLGQQSVFALVGQVFVYSH